MNFAIEIDEPLNRNYHFLPLGRVLRSKCDFLRDPRPEAKVKASTDGPIPGQRLTVRGNTAVLDDLLNEQEHEAIKDKIERKGLKIPKGETFTDIDANTFAWHAKRAVDSGIAKLVSGKFPTIDEAKVKKSFFIDEPPKSPTDRLAAAIEKQTATFEKLLEKLAN